MTPAPSPAVSIQIVNYASPSVCSGPITGATIISTGVCLLTGNSSTILTKTGNIVNVQEYADKACKTAGAPRTIPLNTCTIEGTHALIAYTYAPNTIPPAPFTSTTGQVTRTVA